MFRLLFITCQMMTEVARTKSVASPTLNELKFQMVKSGRRNGVGKRGRVERDFRARWQNKCACGASLTSSSERPIHLTAKTIAFPNAAGYKERRFTNRRTKSDGDL